MLLQPTNRCPAREASPTFKLQVRPPHGLSSGDRWIPPSPVYARNLAGAHWQSELCYGRRGDSSPQLVLINYISLLYCGRFIST